MKDKNVTWYLFAIVLLALSIWWLWYYTHWIEKIYGFVVILGGALALMTRLLSVDDRNDTERDLYSFLVEKRLAFYLAAFLFLGCLVLHAMGASLVFSAASDSRQRILSVEYVGKDVEPRQFGRVGDDSTKKFFWRWSRDQKLRLKLSGLPSIEISPNIGRSNILVPEDFLDQPVLLIRSTVHSAPVINAMVDASSPYVLQVEIEGKSYEKTFSGRAVWVGCDRDVEVPGSTLDQWESRYHLATRKDKVGLPGKVVRSLLPPDTLGSGIRLKKGDVVKFKVVNSDNGHELTVSTEVVIPESYSREDFPLEAIIKLPEDDS